MHDGSVWPGAGDSVETEVAEELARATKICEPGYGSQLVHVALRRLNRQPVEESRHRQPIAAMGGTGPRQLGVVLPGLGQKAGVVALRQIGSSGAKPIEGPGRRGLRIDEHPGLGFAQPVQRGGEGRGWVDCHAVAEMGFRAGRELPPVHKQLDGTILVKNGKTESKGRARYIGAADVQQPGDGIRPGKNGSGNVLGRQSLAQALALVLRAAAGKTDVEGDGGGDWRRRLVRPDGVE